MRNCGQCNKQDAARFNPIDCTCSLPPDDDAPSPLKHKPDCSSVTHEVVLHPIKIDKRDMVFDKEQLLPKWTQRGWRLYRDGKRFFRVKFLCRQCIVDEDIAQERRQEYEKACRETRGMDGRSYAQMLASQ